MLSCLLLSRVLQLRSIVMSSGTVLPALSGVTVGGSEASAVGAVQAAIMANYQAGA